MKEIKSITKNVQLTDEQNLIIEEVLKGNNVFCDACWGSGKTTLLEEIHKNLTKLYPNKSILYLTYNTQLKEEARRRFKCKNIHSYDSFAYSLLEGQKYEQNGLDYSSTLVKDKYINLIPKYDVILIDEYQDINRCHSLIINQLLFKNPEAQFIVVGDRDQKIGNRSSIYAVEFFNKFFSQSKRQVKNLALTISFRLNSKLASLMENIYDKPVKGVNTALSIEYKNNLKDIAKELNNYEPGQILILGGNYGSAKTLQNILHEEYPSKFNKNTLYSSILNRENDIYISKRHDNICLDITYDTCKGLEKDIVVLCDYTEDYWNRRINHMDYSIVKNLFCVAATRAKKRLIFYTEFQNQLLSPQTIKTKIKTENNKDELNQITVSDLISYKPSNLIDEAYSYIKVKKLNDSQMKIDISKTDGLIDTSFIIGEFMQASFFTAYSVDKEIELFNLTHKDYNIKCKPNATIIKKLKDLAAGKTCQNRYKDAKINISDNQKKKIEKRLLTEFNPEYSDIELRYSYPLNKKFNLNGILDAIKNNIVYELKFVSDLKNEHFIQCAIYLLMTDKKDGILWNIQDNVKYSVCITDRVKFKKCLIKLATHSGDVIETKTSNKKLTGTLQYYLEMDKKPKNVQKETESQTESKYFAVVDVETSMNNRDVISLGLIVADDKFNIIESKYFINRFINNGIYASIRKNTKHKYIESSWKDIVEQVKDILNEYKIKNIFAYNTKSTEKRVLFELYNYNWYDIMQFTKNKVFNESYAEKTKTGQYSYSVQSVLRQLSKDNNYREKHIAIDDAFDELNILKLLGQPLNTYKIV